MNILYFCQLYPPALHGGGEYIFFQWARELSKRGHKIVTITQMIKGMNDHEEIDGIEIYRVGPAIEYKGVLPPEIFENIGYVINAIAKGVTILARNDIDVIHSNTYAPALAGQICSNLFRKPHVITFHDICSLKRKDFWVKWASQKGIAASVAVIGPLIEKIVLKLSATLLHTVSETSKRDLLAYKIKKDIIVIPNGVSLEDYDTIGSSDTSDNIQAIYVGRLVFYKNIETIIRALKKVILKIPNAKLIIVGDGPQKTLLKNEEEKLSLTKNIVFTGRVPHKEKVELLKKSSFLVLPSLVEGFGITIIEAYACQKPVLVSEVMPLPEIVENKKDGFTIPPFDYNMWAEKMVYLLDNPHTAQEMGMHGRIKVEQQYTVKRVVDQLENVYFKLTRCK